MGLAISLRVGDGFEAGRVRARVESILPDGDAVLRVDGRDDPVRLSGDWVRDLGGGVEIGLGTGAHGGMVRLVVDAPPEVKILRIGRRRES